MHILRKDLDGLRLAELGKPDVWLMFNGRRHRVGSPQVYDTLFSDPDRIVYSEEISSIMTGPELNHGTCLVRGSGAVAIFMVTGRYPRVTRHPIPTYKSFCDFGFRMDAVKDVPPILLDALVLADDLTSADSDQTGHAFKKEPATG